MGNRKEFAIFLLFVFFFLVVLLRIFYLQIVRAPYYDAWLTGQHLREAKLVAQRWHIYVTDSSDKSLQLTENITLYNLFVDPEHISNKDHFISLITPVVYYHLCKINGFERVDKRTCIENIEDFTKETLIPEAPEVFYFGSGLYSEEHYTYDWDSYNQEVDTIITTFSGQQAMALISEKLTERIKVGFREYNPLGFFSDDLVDDLRELALPYVTIRYGNYVYIQPEKVSNPTIAKNILDPIFLKYDQGNVVEFLPKALEKQKHRYVRLLTDANPEIALLIKQLKILDFYRGKKEKEVYLNKLAFEFDFFEYYRDILETIYSLDYNPKVRYLYRNTHKEEGYKYIKAPQRELYGLWIEPYTKRYYPYNNFMSHVLWYINDDGKPYHGIEEYYHDILRWQNGKITWRSSAWVGQIGANDFEIDKVEHGQDIYLTVDPSIQRQVEQIAERFHKFFRADSLSVLVYDPYSGHIVSSVNYPNFNPNTYYEAYGLRPLTEFDEYVIDDNTHLDIPIYIKTGDRIRQAFSYERDDVTLPKYISNNIFGPTAFADKNITYAYEPGSIFKAFTYAIGLDSDEIDMYDLYDDPYGEVDVGQFTIKNADDKCTGTHNFLFALQYSCNVGMVRIAQNITRYVFYNYIEKLGFGQYTNIELGWEDKWFVESVNKASDARFYNNTFGQWLLATPLQIAVAYWSFFNGGYYMKPTIVKKICDGTECQPVTAKKIRRIFGEDIAEKMKESLLKVMDNPGNQKFSFLEGYTLGGKSGTSQIAYKGKYRQWEWWTNGSFVWIVTEDNLKYVVVVQVRRPRQSQWWGETAGRVFKEVAEFLVGYDLIDK